MGIIMLLIVGFIVFYMYFQITDSKEKKENQKKEALENDFRLKAERLSIKHPGFSDRRYYPYILIPSVYNRKSPGLPYKEEIDPMDFGMNRVKKTLVGKNEVQFGLRLMSKIGKENIEHTQLKYSLYTPDIIYFDRQRNILIDIEIDEPYALKDFRSLHYRDTSFDRLYKRDSITDVNESRDSTFVYGGWSVVRFSEDQVVKYPDECINIVQQLICYLSLTQNETLKSNTEIYHPRWTLAEARQKAKLRTR